MLNLLVSLRTASDTDRAARSSPSLITLTILSMVISNIYRRGREASIKKNSRLVLENIDGPSSAHLF